MQRGRMAGHRIVTFAMVLLGLGCAAGSPPAAAAVPEARADTATIVVSARASISVPSDRARLRFAIETEAETAAEATGANADLTTAAIGATRPLLGPEGDLSTSGFTVSPVYSRDGARNIVGYRATNALTLVLDDLSQVGPAIDAAVGAGANRVDGLTFFAADTRSAYLAALEEAVTRARAEAEVMAAAAGGELGRIVSMQSTRTGQPQVMEMEVAFSRADTPIEAGDTSVQASVNLVIQLLGR